MGVGLPDGPQRIGVADRVTVILETALIALLGSGLFARRRRIAFQVPVATPVAVAVGGVAVLATAIALVDIDGGGHGHGHESTGINAAHVVTR